MDINKLMEQAQQMEKELKKAEAEMKAAEFEGSASNGLVTVTLNGEYKIQRISIDPEILNPDDKEMIEELIQIAVNDAVDKIDRNKTDRMGQMANQFKIPGM